uniref:Glycosyltransferase family 92 protein n=1 Tax=Graphocephala atropunctata TaxID=36148 RepID=A0A1B6MGL9_9HEMI
MGRAARKSLTRDRANLSFFIVIIFFAVFTAIVLTEIFLIDERGRGAAARNSRYPPSRLHHEYEDSAPGAQPGEDYLVYHGESAARLRPPPGHHSATPENFSRLPPLGNLSASAGSWQSVAGTRYKFFVFAAYYERRGQRAVRVIAATKTRGPERVWCRLWYHNGSSSVTAASVPQSVSVPGKVRVIRENWNLKYSACFVLCPLRGNQTAPGSVSVVSRLRVAPSNHLLVHAPSPTVNITGRLAVCIKPLHYNYSQTLKLIEFIELNTLLGVSHFVFYNHTCSAEVSCVLGDYAARQRLTVLPWRLDIASQTEIRTEGLFAALNDCLYRTMYRYSHIALIDLDEFIVPRHNDTLQEFIQWMGKRINTRSTGSYSFQNAFFYLQWADDFRQGRARDALETNLVTLHKTRRRVKLHPHKQRSKYICRPELVVEAGNHFVWELVPGHGTLNVPPDAAIMHHYRVCEFGGDDCVKSASMVDRTLCRYRDRLLRAVGGQWNRSMALCDLPEVTPAPILTTVTPLGPPS